jgi:hypothetical protein
MLTVKKILASLLAGAFIASFGTATLAHPGHLEQDKKSQKRSGKHATNVEKPSTLASFIGQKVSVNPWKGGPSNA